QSVPDCQLPFNHIQIWHKMRIQLRSSYDSKTLLPSQGLHASLASSTWPFGCYNHVIISSDGNNDWPHNGLLAHEVVELHLIFKPILGSQNPLSSMFFAYVLWFTTLPEDPHVGMHVLKQALWSTGERAGDIIPLLQIHSPVHLIPCFGQRVNSQLHSWSLNELSSSFWLNKHWTKELFHTCSS
ncbi:hypothetical protein SCLCIDRAFT_134643, partial [Scleroderma citrinum Foug A]